MRNRLPRKAILVIALIGTVAGLSSCQSVYNAERLSKSDARRESTFVFVRPNRYTLLGTKSLRDYIEVTYEKFTRNQAGQAVVKFGIRNRGGQHWYDRKGPSVTIAAKAVFYESPIVSENVTSAPVYETNWQRIPASRGETIHYSFTSPVDAKGYQITLSDSF